MHYLSLIRRQRICLSSRRTAAFACLSPVNSNRPTFVEAGSRAERKKMTRTMEEQVLMIGNVSMKAIPRAVWILPSLLLIVAVWHLPYGYYTFTRIVTCFASV